MKILHVVVALAIAALPLDASGLQARPKPIHRGNKGASVGTCYEALNCAGHAIGPHNGSVCTDCYKADARSWLSGRKCISFHSAHDCPN